MRASGYKIGDGARRGMVIRWPLVAVAAVVPIALAVALVLRGGDSKETLRTASRSLNAGDWEAAERSLASVRHPLLLSGTQRREAAELYFRLGRDLEGHRLLIGQDFNPRDPADRHLRDLGVRCQLTAADLQRADHSANPTERLRLLREAHSRLPEAPDVLLRLVRADLAAMVRDNSPGAEATFETDYTDLRLHAPHLADRVKNEVASASGGR